MITDPPRQSSAIPNPWTPLRSWWWVAVGLIVFAATMAAGLAIKASGPRPAELGVDVALAHDRNAALSALSMAIHYGLGPIGAVVILVFACLLLVRRSVSGAISFVSVVGVGWLASAAGKSIVARIRPPSDAVQALVHERGLTSFPSGHTAFAFALAGAFVLVVPRTSRGKGVSMAGGAVFVACVAFSRLYLGVHYPTDVLASVVIAAAAILAWLPVWNNLIAPRFSKQDRTPSPAPGPGMGQGTGWADRGRLAGEGPRHADGGEDGLTGRNCKRQDRPGPLGGSTEMP